MREISVKKIVRNYPSDRTGYQVEIMGDEARTFLVRVPNSAVPEGVAASLEERIKTLYADCPLPKHGAIVALGNTGW